MPKFIVTYKEVLYFEHIIEAIDLETAIEQAKDFPLERDECLDSELCDFDGNGYLEEDEEN